MVRGTILFCKKAHCHDDPRYHSLLDVFTSLSAPSFPFWHGFTLWIWLHGELGKAKFTIKVDKTDETEWFTWLEETELDLTGRSECCLAVLADRFCFPRPGEFRFQVKLDDLIVAEQWLTVANKT